MNCWGWRVAVMLAALFLFPSECPAPLVYRPGEGWTYETPGTEGQWTRTRAKDQLEVAEAAFAEQRYDLALKAARRTVKVWPLSDYAPRGQYLTARCLEAKGRDEKAFKAYQTLLERYPKVEMYQEVLERQYEIANQYLNGKWFKLWGTIPAFPSMERTVKMYVAVIKNGPYSPVAPQAQLNIGAAREKQSSFFNKTDPFREAVQAYTTAADRYFDNREVAAEAVFKAGRAYFKQARKADYDQSVAGQAIATFTDFLALYPADPRAAEAQAMIGVLKTEQARGCYVTARYYEKKKRWNGALIYYNEVLVKDRNSPYAKQAELKIEQILKRHAQQTAQR
jgi:outer membrane protein assembly factor BamD